MQSPPTSPDAPSLHVLTEVRYSLPIMLAELKAERAASTFAMEKLDQHEIGKLFKSKVNRRGKPNK